MIPGKDGSLQLGRRFLNWVWYCDYDTDSPGFSELITDIQGHKHRFTVPEYNIQPLVWTRMNPRAKPILPRVFSEIVIKTSDPFVHTITDVIAPKLSFMGAKVLLVGEALAGFRPHVGSSTAQAALHALLAEKWMKGEMRLKEMEEQVMRYARHKSQMGIQLGDQRQPGHLN